MHFVVIYGPTAAGKLSVATELAKFTGYKLLDNHRILNAVAALFPFEDPTLNPIRARLGRKFRLEMFEEAAIAGVDFITTLVIVGPDSFQFIREAKAAVERHQGAVSIVQLRPSLDTIMQRVESASRQGIKVASRTHLQRELTNKPMQFDTFPDQPHLIIDNSQLSPQEVAVKIKSCYKLDTQGRYEGTLLQND